MAISAFGILPGNSRVLVVGLGLTGLSVVRFLSALGIEVAVTDNRANPPGLDECRKLGMDIPMFLGRFERQAFQAATHLIVSPGVSLECEEVFRALEAGLRLLSDIDLFAAIADAPVAGITGSNGKSTVTSLLGRMAEKAKWTVRIGGNYGVPALDLLDPNERPDLYVLELSSFQLERTSHLQCTAAAVLNISADHLDRHGDMESYARSKQSIFSSCTVMILNRDDPKVVAMSKKDHPALCFGLNGENDLDFGVRKFGDGEWIVHGETRLIKSDAVRIKGRQNLSNALAAIALGYALSIPMPAMLKVLEEFPGLPHRMQWVDEFKGVIWINDSKATNVGACAAALRGLSGKVVLIAGGDGKGADFSDLKPLIQQRARAVVLIGRDAGLLAGHFAEAVPCVHASDLKKAVEIAAGIARSGDTVLLSPACASLDQFRDYQERGRVFEQAVRELKRAH